jgi:hypothetical protein
MRISAIAGGLLWGLTAPLVLGAIHAGKTVSVIQSPTPSGDCLYFSLVGVPQADPISPGNPWFALPHSHTGFKEAVAILMAAKLSQQTITVETTGTAAGGTCGAYPLVYYVLMDP